MDLTFWYGSEREIGLKETKRRRDIENRNRGEERMMPLTVMTEEDMIRIVTSHFLRNAVSLCSFCIVCCEWCVVVM